MKNSSTISLSDNPESLSRRLIVSDKSLCKERNKRKASDATKTEKNAKKQNVSSHRSL